MAVVRLNRLEAGYERPLVRIESAELQPGERVALTGDNGSGKTTLLKTLVGQLAPLAGRCECPEPWRIGYLPQQGEEDRQFPLSVYEWVLSGFWARRACGGIDSPGARNRISAVFLENVASEAMVRQIQRETQVKLGGTLYSDALSEPDGPAGTYEAMMQHNLETILNSLWAIA